MNNDNLAFYACILYFDIVQALYDQTNYYNTLCVSLYALCTGEVTIQPNDVTVIFGEVAVFTCIVKTSENFDNMIWKRFDNIGNALTLANTNHYMISNDFKNGATQLNSTLIITDVRMEHVGLYQFVATRRDVIVISRKTFLTVLEGTLKSFYKCVYRLYNIVQILHHTCSHCCLESQVDSTDW